MVSDSGWPWREGFGWDGGTARGEPMNPDEELAQVIVEHLVAHGLIGEKDRRQEVWEGLAGGTARQDDWRLWVEIGTLEKAASA